MIDDNGQQLAVCPQLVGCVAKLVFQGSPGGVAGSKDYTDTIRHSNAANVARLWPASDPDPSIWSK